MRILTGFQRITKGLRKDWVWKFFFLEIDL